MFRVAISVARFTGFLLSALLLLALGAVNPVAHPTPTPFQDDDVVRIESDLTNLLFNANDKDGRFITSLRESDIRVLEDGVPQMLFTFQRETDRPLSIAFLIDVSISEERTLPQEKAAARVFIENVIRSSKDQAAIVPFEGYAHVEQPLTRDVLAILRTLEQVEVAYPTYLGSAPALTGITSGPGTVAPPNEGSTAIWDSVALTCRRVLARDRAQRRRAIILLTDGQDSTSRLRRVDAIDQAIQAETVVYAIGIGDKKYQGVNKGALREIAERTGGRAFFPKKEDDLRSAFAEIEQELRSQYLIAYSSANKKRDGAFRTITVEITSPEFQKQGLKLRYRPGYFAKKGS
ncbi:MAG TPA: VWA domain-containing protein [Pyrinomonadaceae bacterium]|nr:VWA domain-containing protein [Pyrinomonadaceae bacterium]